MSVGWATRPPMVQQPQDWHDPSRPPPFDAPSPPQTAFPGSTSISQRRRSSAANNRPSVPPPSIPIPSLPLAPNLLAPEPAAFEVFEDGSLPSAHINGRPMFTNTYTRPAPSPSLSAVASFSQSRQAVTATSSSLGYSIPQHQGSDDLSDPPPGSYFQSGTSSPPSSRRADVSAPDNNLLRPDLPEQSGRSGERSEHRPSSRRALTRALALAREAVQLDSTNDNPEAAVQAYARSVALLSEVMDRVRRGEDSTDGRRRRRRSVAAQEDEIRRLQSIHDTYADRMNILSIIYSIPPVPYSTTSSSYSSTSVDSVTSTSPPTSASPASDGSPQLPHQNPAYNHMRYTSEEVSSHSQEYGAHSRDLSQPRDTGSVYILDEQVLTGTAIPMTGSASQHPYAATVEAPSSHSGLPSTPPQVRNSIMGRRPRASSNLPPAVPPPSNSLPPAPILLEPRSDAHLLPRSDSLSRPSVPESSNPRRVSGSYLSALAEENDDTVIEIRERLAAAAIDTPRNVRRESPPLPPIPTASPPLSSHGSAPNTPRHNSFLTKDPSSPRLASLATARPRGTSQLTTRSELANASQSQVINTTTSQGTIYQRRSKTSAPPSTRSSSPTPSTASGGSGHQIRTTSSSGAPPIPNGGRSRSSSQPGRRPSLVGGRVSPGPPPLPNNGAINGMRKSSFPSKLAPVPPSLQLDPLQPPFSNSPFQLSAPGALLSPTAYHPTTPTSPLPPRPPTDPLLKPYHMMSLLRTTIMSPTGGYITPRLHVPCEVWSQGGAKLSNIMEKVRIVSILCQALEELQTSSSEYFGAGNVSSGMAMGIGSIGKKEAEAWLGKLDDFSNVCDGVVANFGKKLGVGEGFVSKKTTWGDKLSRRFDKFTNGKNLDSPAAYVAGLKRLFMDSQLLDEHTRAVIAQPVAPSYAGIPVDIRISVEYRLKRCSEFFATVVLTFVVRDLSQLLDKYAKKCEKWLAE